MATPSSCAPTPDAPAPYPGPVTTAKRALLLVGAVAMGLAVSGCGARPQRTALAVESVRWDGAMLVVRTECNEGGGDANGAPDAHDPTLYRLSIHGEPTVGRCHPELRIPVPLGTTKLLDITTSQVIDLPPH
jgi:hypothetical protein